MASCQTTRWASTSPYVKLTVTQSSSDGDSAVLSWTLQYISDYAASTNSARSYKVTLGGSTVKEATFSINGKTGTHTIASGTKTIAKGTSAKSVAFGVSFSFNLTWSGSYKGTLSASGSISVAAKTSYSIKYNANGGSGAPSSQTKWYGTALILSSTKPTRTGYKFSKWNTAAGGGGTNYNAGASYTANAAATLYAQWTANTYTVSYDANGGTGAPSSQTKTYGVSLTLSNTKPTRTNYNFLGWSTSTSATVKQYDAGETYTANAAVTLYAVWELAYEKPVIRNLTASRCTDTGDITDDGTYARIEFKWETSQEVSSIVASWLSSTGEETGSATISGSSGTSGTTSQIVGGTFDTETSYAFTVTVTDSSGNTDCSTSRSATMSGCEYHIDFGENSVAIGKPAEALPDSDGSTEKTFDVNWRMLSRNHLCVGDKRWYHDGNQGIFLSNEGFMHLQRTSAQGYHPYIGFYIDDSTEADGQTRLNCDTGVMEFLGASGYKLDNDVEIAQNLDFLTNAKAIFGVDPNGLRKNTLQPQNENGNTIVGYGNYSAASGNTNIYGHDVNIGVSNIATPGTFRPYRRRGDTQGLTLRAGGYVTNSGKDVVFWIPVAVPIIGSPTVTISSGSGFVLRQDNKYTHGSSASTAVSPSSYEAAITAFHGIYVKAVFSNTTNVVNNAPIGIQWNGTITFS